MLVTLLLSLALGDGNVLLQGDTDVKIISKDEDANTIAVDGGNWSTPTESEVWSDSTDCC